MGYGKCLSVVLIAILASATVSSAKYETVTAGPYRVSFHLNTSEQYDIGVKKPHYGETYEGVRYIHYVIQLNNSYGVRRALIAVTFHNSNEMDKSAEYNKKIIEEFLEKTHCVDIKTYERVIDRQLGVLGVGTYSSGNTTFYAIYWPALSVSGDTRVEISSVYPWMDGTLDLLKTISVEMVGSPPPL